jgi:hypothetical protein
VAADPLGALLDMLYEIVGPIIEKFLEKFIPTQALDFVSDIMGFISDAIALVFEKLALLTIPTLNDLDEIINTIITKIPPEIKDFVMIILGAFKSLFALLFAIIGFFFAITGDGFLSVSTILGIFSFPPKCGSDPAANAEAAANGEVVDDDSIAVFVTAFTNVSDNAAAIMTAFELAGGDTGSDPDEEETDEEETDEEDPEETDEEDPVETGEEDPVEIIEVNSEIIVNLNDNIHDLEIVVGEVIGVGNHIIGLIDDIIDDEETIIDIDKTVKYINDMRKAENTKELNDLLK